HASLCENPRLAVMLNFAINPAIRSSQADYLLISGGDILFSEHLAARLVQEGLQPGCLYRAERVTIRNDLGFPHCSRRQIEDPANIVMVDTCSEPPYNTPPFTNASGDFILIDRLTMMGLRGFDEGVRNARLHLDSKLCRNAMAIGMSSKLMGRIFHIDHQRSYNRMLTAYP